MRYDMKYDMIWDYMKYDMMSYEWERIWYDMILDMIWYDTTWHTMIYDMTWHVIWHKMIWDMIWHGMTWHFNMTLQVIEKSAKFFNYEITRSDTTRVDNKDYILSLAYYMTGPYTVFSTWWCLGYRKDTSTVWHNARSQTNHHNPWNMTLQIYTSVCHINSTVK